MKETGTYPTLKKVWVVFNPDGYVVSIAEDAEGAWNGADESLYTPFVTLQDEGYYLKYCTLIIPNE